MGDFKSSMDFAAFMSENAELNSAFKAACRAHSFKKGKIIIGQDDPGKGMFILREGKAKVVIYSEEGHEIWLADFAAGTSFGEMAILLDTTRTSNVVAASDCTVDFISAADFTDMLHRFPEFSIYMLRLMAQRLQYTSRAMFEGLSFTVPQRIYEELLRRSEQDAQSKELYHLSPAPSVTQLSEILNISRESASRAVTRLSKQGLLKKRKKHWEILRPTFGDY